MNPKTLTIMYNTAVGMATLEHRVGCVVIPYVPVMNPIIDALGPPLAARILPVMAPLPMEFHGSSLSRIAIRAQSKDEYIPPQTAKLPGEKIGR